MTATKAARRASWALPPQPPETWVGGLWLTTFLLALAVAVFVPMAPTWGSADRELTLLAELRTIAAVAAVVAGFALVVQATVYADPWMRWAACGYGAAALLALAPAAPLEDASPPAFARALWAVLAATCAVGAARWLASQLPMRRWIAVGLALTAVGAGIHAAATGHRDALWWSALLVQDLSLLVPALGMGGLTVWGYGRQSRRWRQLEAEVKALRRGSRLLEGRSITPEDDEGLPSYKEVRKIIELAAVRVALQPVIELSTGVTVGSEALSRFGGRVPTDRWFKAARKHGQGEALERLCLATAIGLLPTLPPEQFLAVNISPATLSDSAVLGLLRGADLRRLVVEITEHEAVADYAVTRGVLGTLRAAGARIAVDDTGAGFASLRHVLMLQPDIIKLDIGLTRDVDVDRRQQALVRAVTAFAAQVGTTVLAEGIETQEQLDTLREIGVQLGQGWHLGVPVLTT